MVDMTHYQAPTKERIACVSVVAAAGGKLNHDDPRLSPYCDDKSTLTKPDVFNQCHDAGWLISGHDDRTDDSYVHLTKEGRAMLAQQCSEQKTA